MKQTANLQAHTVLHCDLLMEMPGLMLKLKIDTLTQRILLCMWNVGRNMIQYDSVFNMSSGQTVHPANY